MLLEMEIIGKLFLSAFLGMMIGWERQLRNRPAGVREHGLVCMGSAMFTIISIIFASPLIAAGVVTGIGFLGAGSILHLKNKVIGLTTAAELWVVAAIGLAVGIGLYTVSAITALLVLLILLSGRYVEKRK